MKGPEAFRTISEAADELGVPQHVLRFWETKFSFIRPMKRAGGRRFYRRQDIDVLRGVQSLLHREGYTIKGVQRMHREHGVRRVLAASTGEGDRPSSSYEPPVTEAAEAGFDLRPTFAAPSPHKPVLIGSARDRLADILADLEGVKARLDAELGAKNS